MGIGEEGLFARRPHLCVAEPFHFGMALEHPRNEPSLSCIPGELPAENDRFAAQPDMAGPAAHDHALIRVNEEVGPQKIREYVYYMETKEPLPAEQPKDEPYFMGLCRNTAYYFYYERESVTTLDHAFLATIQTKAEGYTIYADLCAVPQETLRKHNITFKKIPRDIARL